MGAVRRAAVRCAALCTATLVVVPGLVLVAPPVAGSVTAVVTAAQPGGTAAQPTGEVEPIHLAIAVDESSSLSESDVQQERIAAASIAMGELSARSDVTVFGFGSNTGSARAVDATRQCVLAPGARAQDREAMGACVYDKIRRRKNGHGDSTDFVAAIDQGVAALTTGAGARTGDGVPRVLLMLTDGRLDVRGDTHYGADEASQQRNAERSLKERVVPKAKRSGVQIWPLGFGTGIDQDMLDYLAAHGARARCDDTVVVPEGTPAKNAAAAVAAMQAAFARLRCLGTDRTDDEEIDSGGEVDLSVTVPAIATDGVINVVKGDPGVKVTYTDPRGHRVPTVGTVDDSTFELAGSSGVVESLRVRNPRPGTWKIRLVAPERLGKRLVSATALWRGVLRTTFEVDPPSPLPGQKFSVIMRPQTRTHQLTAAALAGLVFHARVTGPGLERSARLADDGAAPDPRRDDAWYYATFTLPAGATGEYRVSGTASGTGVTSDHQEKVFAVAADGPRLRMALVLDDPAAEAVPGDEVTGRILVTNDGAERPVLFRLDGVSRPGTVTLRPDRATVGAGHSEIRFAVRVSRDAGEGEVAGVLRMVDATGGEPLGNGPVAVTVLPEPWPLWAYPLVVAGVAAVLAAIVLALLRRRRSRARDLHGVTFSLYEEGQSLASVEVRRSGARFDFDIQVPTDGMAPGLKTANPHSGRYRAERAPAGKIRVYLPAAESTPEHRHLDLVPGRVSELPNHPRLGLRVEDGRPPARAREFTPAMSPGASPPPAPPDDPDI